METLLLPETLASSNQSTRCLNQDVSVITIIVVTVMKTSDHILRETCIPEMQFRLY